MKKVSPSERLTRMREMFDSERAVLAEDYEHFTRPSSPDAPIRPSKAGRKSGMARARRAPKRS